LLEFLLSFCLKIEEESILPKMIKPLHDGIKYNLIARDHILQGLINLISSTHNQLERKQKFKQNLSIIDKVTESFLPTLFNVVISKQTKKNEKVLKFITKIASIIQLKKRRILFNVVLRNLLQSMKVKNSYVEGLFDVIIALTSCLDQNSVSLLWKFLTTQFNNSCYVKKYTRFVQSCF
jgi:hypothetical protein